MPPMVLLRPDAGCGAGHCTYDKALTRSALASFDESDAVLTQDRQGVAIGGEGDSEQASEVWEGVVYILDDDAAVRDSLVYLTRAAGLQPLAFATAEALLGEVRPQSKGCLVLDLRLPGVNGLDVHETLRERGVWLPTIVVTGHGEVPLAVRAIQSGAFDFIEKPLSDDRLLPQIRAALRAGRERREEVQRLDGAKGRHRSLTPREREVMGHVVRGRLNKQIAEDLGLSPKTVEVHRANVMSKMAAGSLADLVREAVALEAAGVVVRVGGDPS